MSIIAINSHISPDQDNFKSDKLRYEWQVEARANFLLIDDDTPNVPITIKKHPGSIDTSKIRWLNQGELIAGSFLCNLVHTTPKITVGDIDIYFKSKEDAQLFTKINRLSVNGDISTANVTLKARLGSTDFNLIFGVHYSSPQDLISRFDIRACSIAYDPTNAYLYYVTGALGDCSSRRIIFNPVPHNTTVARLVKYVEKGFQIDAYQRLFFANLISDRNYNPELELTTGYRGVNER